MASGTVAAITIAGCNQDPTDDAYGSASVAALTSGDVDYVVITAESPPGNIVDEQTIEGDGSGNFPPVQFDELEVGAYTFGARAYEDLDGLPHDPLVDTLLYEGTADATITEGVQAGVIIVLQQSPPDPFDNTVPIFQSLVYTPANPRTDEVITLTATVSDPDVGDVVSLSWTAPGGGTLTPPARPSKCRLDRTVERGDVPGDHRGHGPERGDRDADREHRGVTSPRQRRGHHRPQHLARGLEPGAGPDAHRRGGEHHADADGQRRDGDDLAYAWSATGCAGIFSDATAASPASNSPMHKATPSAHSRSASPTSTP